MLVFGLSLPERGVAYAFAALLFLFILCGGGGPHAPLLGALIELAALGAILFLSVRALIAGRPLAVPLPIVIAIVAIIGLIVAQLLPLPFAWWSALPGREAIGPALREIGLAAPMRPLSIEPWSTFAAGRALLPALATIFLTAALRPDDRILLVKAILAAGLLSGLLGLIQYAAPGWTYLYAPETASPGCGVFANPNHQVDLMLGCVLLCGWLVGAEKGQIPLPAAGSRHRPRARAPLHVAWLALPFFVAMTVLTGSRAGLLFVIPATALALGLALGWRVVLRIVLAGLVLLPPIMVWLFYSGREFFEFGGGQGSVANEMRLRAIPDLVYAIQTYAPFGSGLGTFDTVFRRAESLDVVKDTYFNHAHNDYIELLIEAGWLGVALAAIGILYLLVRTGWIELRGGDSRYRGLQVVMGAFLVLVCIHSIVDYPLRTYAVSCFFAFAAMIVASPTAPSQVRRRVRVRQ